MPGNEPLLSVCCLGYRHAPFIRDCVTSIWNGGYENLEIIAMDDGSGDDSVEILKELQAENHCPMKILEQENSGNIAANFNRLFKQSRGDYILFTSLDDMQLPGALKSRMDVLLANENCVFAAHPHGLSLDQDGSLRPETSTAASLATNAATLLELERTQLHSFFIQGAIFKRSAVEAVHAFSENMLGDDIVLRTKIFFHLQAHPELTFAMLDEPGFIYRKHAGNISLNVLRLIELALQYCDKFWGNQPYPKMIKNWLLTGLVKEPYEKILTVFTLTPRAAKLLLDEEIQKALRANAVRSYIKEKEKC